ncbi:hypothetical protein ACP70R_043081 [Stipagrostis hirtigluma subsp. patula]
MATSTAPLRSSSYQITGSLAPAAPRHAPAVKIRSWRRFAASRCEVALLPTLRLRPPSRRRNALRQKAWPPPPLPLAIQHQVRPPYDEYPEFGGLDSQEPKFGCLDGETSSQLDDRSDISGSLGASPTRNVASESELDSQEDVIRVADEEIAFCETGAGPVFSVHEDPEGNMVHVDVEEAEIINRSDAVVGEQSGDSDDILYRAREIAKELESGGRGAPKNSSLFHFVAAGRMASPVLNEEGSVAQRKVAPFGSAPWGGFAVLFSVCFVCVVSKIWRSSKAKLLSRLFYMHRPGVEGDEFNNGNMRMLENLHGFPGDTLRRPHLDRKQLMNNIKRAKETREWFVISSPFRCKSITNVDDSIITEIRKTITEVHTQEDGKGEQSSTEECNGTVFPHPILTIDEEVSGSYGSQSYIDDASDSSKLTVINPSNDKIEDSGEQIEDSGEQIEDSGEQIADMKNGAPVMNTSEKDQDGIGEIELTVPTYDDERVTGGNDRASVIDASEKEAKFGSVTAQIFAYIHARHLHEASCAPFPDMHVWFAAFLNYV